MTICGDYSKQKSALYPGWVLAGANLIGAPILGFYVLGQSTPVAVYLFIAGPVYGTYVALKCRREFLIVKNEKLTISADSVTWVDRNGKAKVSCRLDEVLPGSFTAVDGYASGYGIGGATGTYPPAKTGSKIYSVKTPGGEIRWNTRMSNAEELAEVVAAAAGQQATPSITSPKPEFARSSIAEEPCKASFRMFRILFVSFFLLVWGVGFSVPQLISIYQLMSRQNTFMKINGEQATSSSIPLLAVMSLIGLSVIGLSVLAALAFKNARVTFDGRELHLRDALGRETTIDSRDLRAGNVRAIDRPSLGVKYEVVAAGRRIAWSFAMAGAENLYNRVRATALANSSEVESSG